jgi:hypothetical protein
LDRLRGVNVGLIHQFLTSGEMDEAEDACTRRASIQCACITR